MLSYSGYGVVMSMCAAFNGVGFPMPAVFISAARALVLLLPLAFIGQWFFGLNGLFCGAAAANIVGGYLSYGWLGRNLRIYGPRALRAQ